MHALHHLCLTVCLFVLLAGAGLAECPMALNVSGCVDASDPRQSARVNMDGLPSACDAKRFPGTIVRGAVHYETRTVTNTSGAPQWVRVTSTVSGPNPLFTAACLGSFDAANVSAGYLGNAGRGRPSATQPNVSA